MEEKILFLLSKLCLAQKNILWEQGYKYSLSPTQIEILFAISSYNKPITISLLAKEMAISKPTISDSVYALEKKALVKKIPMKDRRKVGIKITGKGKNIIKSIHKKNPLLNITKTSLNNHEKSSLFQALLKITSVLKDNGYLQIVRTCPYCGNLIYKASTKSYLCAISKKNLSLSDFQINCQHFKDEGEK